MTEVRPGSVPRRGHLSREEFAREFLRPDRPVVVEDGARSWAALSHWTPDFLRTRFGELNVTLQGDQFSSLGTMRLADFLDRVEELEGLRSADFDLTQPVPYMRYASSFSDVDDLNTAALSELSEHWERPYFLPPSLYVWPLDLVDSRPNRKRYPDFGVYISPRGAMTRLHVDTNRDCAVLCQVHGRKRGFLFPPGQDGRWPSWYPPRPELPPRTPEAVALLDGERPEYGGLTAFEFEIGPGDVLFIPKFWAHEVFTVSASVSVTYNFMNLRSVNREWLIYFLTRRLPKIVAIRLGLRVLPIWRRLRRES